MSRLPLWIPVLSLLSFFVACGGTDGGDVPDAGSPAAEGMAVSVTGLVTDSKPSDAGDGGLQFKFVLGEQTISQKVSVQLSQDGQVVKEGTGDEAFSLAPGLYSASLTYRESDQLPPSSGVLSKLKVNEGATTSYKVGLDVPLGRLRMEFRQLGAGGSSTVVSEQVDLTVYRSGGDGDVVFWEGPASETIVLGEGLYDVKARVSSGTGPAVIEWYRAVSIEGEMRLTELQVGLQPSDSGVRIDVFNFSSDVNKYVQVAFFQPDADLRRAIAVRTGTGGQLLDVEPGLYDVLVRYTPSSDVESDRLLRGFEVPAEGGLRFQLDLKQEMGLLKLAFFDGDQDVSSRVNLIAKRAGADAAAGLSVLDVVGVGAHPIPAGTYDLYFDYASAGSERRKDALPGITIANGAIWEQRFDAAAPQWIPAPAKLPAAPLRPIDWQEETRPVDGAAGDDDDSAGDDDDSAGREAPAADDDDSASSSVSHQPRCCNESPPPPSGQQKTPDGREVPNSEGASPESSESKATP